MDQLNKQKTNLKKFTINAKIMRKLNCQNVMNV